MNTPLEINDISLTGKVRQIFGSTSLALSTSSYDLRECHFKVMPGIDMHKSTVICSVF